MATNKQVEKHLAELESLKRRKEQEEEKRMSDALTAASQLKIDTEYLESRGFSESLEGTRSLIIDSPATLIHSENLYNIDKIEDKPIQALQYRSLRKTSIPVNLTKYMSMANSHKEDDDDGYTL